MTKVEIETHLKNRHRGAYGRSPISIRFEALQPSTDHSVELTTYNPSSSVLRLMDDHGAEIWHLDRLSDPAEFRLEVAVRNLHAGTYFVEIQDGFFHQVRTVRIAAA